MGEAITSFEHDGLVFDVIDGGPREGDPVVLLHGFPQRAVSWSGVAARLQEAGLRAIAPDQRGYSPGARPAGRSAYRMENLVGDVLALIDEIGGPVHLVGHDWGAAVAWCVAGRHADRVRTLTTVSVPHPSAMQRAMRHGQLRASWYIGFFQLPWLPEKALRTMPAGRLARMGIRGGTLDVFRRGVLADGALTGGLGWYRALPLHRRDLAAGRVRVPTTHVWSDRDGALVRYGAEHSGDYVTAPYTLEILEGVGHFIPEEAPDALADLILARVTG